MITHKEALKLALEALQDSEDQLAKPYSTDVRRAITAIKEALSTKCVAQPELCKYGQEPKSCTSSPMDCQCALDATFEQPAVPQGHKQEPVAKYMGETYRCPIVNLYKDIPVGTLLYTAPPQGIYYTPPQRTWVGLMDEEKSEIYHNQKFVVGFYSPAKFADAVEAKLKEKNT